MKAVVVGLARFNYIAPSGAFIVYEENYVSIKFK